MVNRRKLDSSLLFFSYAKQSSGKDLSRRSRDQIDCIFASNENVSQPLSRQTRTRKRTNKKEWIGKSTMINLHHILQVRHFSCKQRRENSLSSNVSDELAERNFLASIRPSKIWRKTNTNEIFLFDVDLRGIKEKRGASRSHSLIQSKLTSTEDLPSWTPEKVTIGTSAFIPAGYSKVLSVAFARSEKLELQIPYQSHPDRRKLINQAKLAIIGLHLGRFGK